MGSNGIPVTSISLLAARETILSSIMLIARRAIQLEIREIISNMMMKTWKGIKSKDTQRM